MPSENITIDISSLNKIASGLSNFQKEMPGAVASSLNRTVDFMNTRIGRLVASEYVIKVSEVKKTITKIKARKGDMKAGLKSTGHTLSLAHFPYKPNDPLLARMLSIRYGTPIKVKIKKREGYKEIKTTRKPFIASTGAKSADKVQFNVFKRIGRGKSRTIAPLRTLSVPQMIQNVNVGNNIQKAAAKKLEERVEHEIEYRLSKLRSR